MVVLDQDALAWHKGGRPNKAMNLTNVAMLTGVAPFAGYGQRSPELR
jgi:hypothetical protein